jgi:thiol-disulfide isomerase/thioredoxin
LLLTATRDSLLWRATSRHAVVARQRLTPDVLRAIASVVNYRSSGLTRLGFAVAFVGAVLGATSCGAGGSAGSVGPNDASDVSASEPSTATAITNRPPDFELETLDGDVASLDEYLGKDVILIDFWATWCDPCLTAMPHLETLYKKYKDQGFVVLGVNIDGPDSMAEVRSKVAQLGVTFPILLDSETRVVALYNPKTSAPYSVLIARDGQVLAKKEGYTAGDAGSLDADIQKALAAK